MKTKPSFKIPTQSPPLAVHGADIWELQPLEEQCWEHSLLAPWVRGNQILLSPLLHSSQTSCTGYKYLKLQSTKFKEGEVWKPNPVCSAFCVLWPASSILQNKVNGTGSGRAGHALSEQVLSLGKTISPSETFHLRIFSLLSVGCGIICWKSRFWSSLLF